MRPAYLSAALPLRSVRRPLFRRGGFRRRKRLFVRPFGAALSLRSVRRFGAALPLRPARRFGGAPAPPGSPLRCGALAHARFAALCFGGALAPLGSPPSVSAALPLALGSPLRCGALWRRSRSRSVRRFGGAPARARLAASVRRSRSRSARRPLFRRGGFRRRKRLFVRLFGAALSLRSVRRFGALLRRPRPKAVKKIKK